LCAEGGEGSVGSIDSLLRVLGVEFGASADQFPRSWVVNLECLAGGGLDPFAIDVADIGLEEGRVSELEAWVCLAGVSSRPGAERERDKTYLGRHG
jgi:hypothetical protein